MKLKTLDLRTHLIKMGIVNLIEIFGEKKIETLSLIINKNITETIIADLLIKINGTEIFSDNLLRGYIIHYLPPEYKSYLAYEDETKSVSENEEKKLIDRAWNRSFNFYKRLIKIFDLNDDYLPDYPVEIEKVKSVNSKNSINETIIQKIIKFILSLFSKSKSSKGLFDYQVRIKDQILHFFRINKKKMIIHMPTGSGKTKTVLTAILEYHLQNSFLDNNYVTWLAHSDELCTQAFETFESIWKDYGVNTTQVMHLKDQDINDIEKTKGGLIISTYQKLHKTRIDRFGFKILEKIREKNFITICDEAHMVPAQTFKDSIEFIKKLDFTTIIGLSATPGGYYEEDTENLASYFELNKISITDENNKDLDDPIRYLQKQEFLSEIKARQIATNFNFEFDDDEKKEIVNKLDFKNELIHAMSEDNERNICILAELKNLYDKGNSVIVFACSLEHSKLLNSLCVLLDMNTASIDDKTRPNKRKKIIKEFKEKKIKIIFNYGILSTGFDAPGTNAILIARPTTSPILYSQMLGRGIRGPKLNGNKVCLLIDIKDNLIGLPDERQCFALFNKYYIETSYEQTYSTNSNRH